MSKLTVIEPRKVTEDDLEELKRLLRKDCIDGILADAAVRPAEYVKNYNAGRGGE
jgi:hypothetical protein